MKKIIVILWILLMIAALSNMALQNKVDKLERENYRLKEVIENRNS